MSTPAVDRDRLRFGVLAMQARLFLQGVMPRDEFVRYVNEAHPDYPPVPESATATPHAPDCQEDPRHKFSCRPSERHAAAILDGDARWPEAVSDGAFLPCSDCGVVPRFDYVVEDDFWRRWVPGPERLSVVCLPCLDRRCGGVDLVAALKEVHWTGTGHTVVLGPTLRVRYTAARFKAAGR